MLKDITLGQYFPGNSVIHRLDPRTKLLALLVFIVLLVWVSAFICQCSVCSVLTGVMVSTTFLVLTAATRVSSTSQSDIVPALSLGLALLK